MRYMLWLAMLLLIGCDKPQSNAELERLRAENEFLKQKLDGTTDPAPKDDKLSYTKKWAGPGGGDEVLYVLEKVTREGREVNFEFTATLKKGNRKFTGFSHLTGIDQAGNPVKIRLNVGERSPKSYGVQAPLVLGEAIRFVVVASIPDDIKVLKSAAFAGGLKADIPEIKFEQIILPAKLEK